MPPLPSPSPVSRPASRLCVVLTLLLMVAARGAAAEVAIQPDVVYGHKDGLAMTFDVYRPEEPNGGTILFKAV